MITDRFKTRRNLKVKAWWCSGHSEKAAMICAIVDADSVEQAEKDIRQAWDSNGKDIGGFRFIEERENDWLPSERFPITKDWVKERLGLTKQ